MGIKISQFLNGRPDPDTVCGYCKLTESQQHHSHYMMDKVVLLGEINQLKSEIYYLKQDNRKLLDVVDRLTKSDEECK